MQSVVVTIKQTFCASFLSLAVISFPPPPCLAMTVDEVPNPRQVNNGWVTDMANVLSPSTEAELNQLISELEAKNGSEIAVVTVPDTSPAATPKKFATALFKHWGIGKKGQDNGVLFLISTHDHQVEIETGYGVERILPDARVGNIIKQEIAPRFKKGDFDGGTLVGTKALATALSGEAYSTNTPTPTSSANTPTYSANAPTDSSNKLGLLAGVWVLVGMGTLIGLAVLLIRASSDDDDSDGGGNGRHRRHRGGSSSGSSYYGGTSSSSTSSGSTSSGDGSFGGGSSGGGGAGGSF